MNRNFPLPRIFSVCINSIICRILDITLPYHDCYYICTLDSNYISPPGICLSCTPLSCRRLYMDLFCSNFLTLSCRRPYRGLFCSNFLPLSCRCPYRGLFCSKSLPLSRRHPCKGLACSTDFYLIHQSWTGNNRVKMQSCNCFCPYICLSDSIYLSSCIIYQRRASGNPGIYLNYLDLSVCCCFLHI